MKIQVTSYVYESMRKLHDIYTPEIGGVYIVESDGTIRDKYSHIEHDGEKWVWVPHEDSLFKVQPLSIEFKILDA